MSMTLIYTAPLWDTLERCLIPPLLYDLLVWHENEPLSCLDDQLNPHSLVIPLVERPLGVSVVITRQRHWIRLRTDTWEAALLLRLPVISVLSHSVPVFILRYISVWLSLFQIIFFHFVTPCSLSLILQLRLVRYAVPLLMIGCLYYKVCHFLCGLRSSLYSWSHYGAVLEKKNDMRKGKIPRK